MISPRRAALLTASVTGVILIIPSSAIAQEVAGPGGEVVARWLALSLTAFGMIASGGIAWGVAKTAIGSLERRMGELAADSKGFASRADCSRIHELEARVAKSEMGAVREIAEMVKGSMDGLGEQVAGLRHEIAADRKEMLLAIEKAHSRMDSLVVQMNRRAGDKAPMVEGP